MTIMEGLRDEGRRLIFASHDPLVYESPLIERIVRMRDGRVLDPGRAS
jgi:putative ABC transport system ATP-binding protein